MEAILQNLADATEAMNSTRSARTASTSTRRSATSTSITANGEPQMAKILENVRQITDDVRELIAANQGKRAPASDIRDTIDEPRRGRRKTLAGRALSTPTTSPTRIDAAKGTIGRLTKDETLINEVQGVAEGVNDYVGGITRLQTIVGLRTDYNFLANTIKSYVVAPPPAARGQVLRDRAHQRPARATRRFIAADGRHDQPDDAARTTRRITTTTTQRVPLLAPVRAGASGPFTGRFGIKESTGGIGLDLHLLQDRFEIVNDLFGFGEEVEPRYRVYVELRVHQPALAARPASTTSSRPTSATTSSGCSSASPTTT